MLDPLILTLSNFNNFNNFRGNYKNVHKLSRGDAYHVVLGLQYYMMDEIDNRYKQKLLPTCLRRCKANHQEKAIISKIRNDKNTALFPLSSENSVES